MSPEEFIINFYLKNNHNSMISNLIQMARNNNSDGVEAFARNLMREKGRDFDKEFSVFMSQFNR